MGGRASTAGHLSLAISAMSEVQTESTMGNGVMGFVFLTASFGWP